jgi:hypothetical protein
MGVTIGLIEHKYHMFILTTTVVASEFIKTLRPVTECNKLAQKTCSWDFLISEMKANKKCLG